jgi:hypothetical protein
MIMEKQILGMLVLSSKMNSLGYTDMKLNLLFQIKESQQSQA